MWCENGKNDDGDDDDDVMHLMMRLASETQSRTCRPPEEMNRRPASPSHPGIPSLALSCAITEIYQKSFKFCRQDMK